MVHEVHFFFDFQQFFLRNPEIVIQLNNINSMHISEILNISKSSTKSQY